MSDKPDGNPSELASKALAERVQSASAGLADAQKRLDKARDKLAECVAKLEHAEGVLRAALSAQQRDAKRTNRQ